MAIDIRRTTKTTAAVTVDGKTYNATYDRGARRWTVNGPTGPMQTSSPKLHSIGRLFGPAINVNGAPKRAPRPSTAPRAPRTAGPRKPRGRAFSAQPSVRDLMLVALAATEDVFAAKFGAKGAVITDEARKSYEKYLKLKALALGATSSPEAEREAFSALRMSLIETLKLAL